MMDFVGEIMTAKKMDFIVRTSDGCIDGFKFGIFVGLKDEQGVGPEEGELRDYLVESRLYLLEDLKMEHMMEDIIHLNTEIMMT